MCCILAGTTAYEPDYVNHTYTVLGTYILTGIAQNAIGNTTIKYTVNVQIPVSPLLQLTSTAPVSYPDGMQPVLSIILQSIMFSCLFSAYCLLVFQFPWLVIVGLQN